MRHGTVSAATSDPGKRVFALTATLVVHAGRDEVKHLIVGPLWKKRAFLWPPISQEEERRSFDIRFEPMSARMADRKHTSDSRTG